MFKNLIITLLLCLPLSLAAHSMTNSKNAEVKKEKKDKKEKKAKKNEETVDKSISYSTAYVYAIATSFSDSICYMTDVQRIDNAYFTGKGKFLGGIKEYVRQFNGHLVNAGAKNRTVTVFFDKKLKDAEKHYVKLRRRYSNTSNYDLRPVIKDQFTFSVVSPE